MVEGTVKWFGSGDRPPIRGDISGDYGVRRSEVTPEVARSLAQATPYIENLADRVAKGNATPDEKVELEKRLADRAAEHYN